MHLVVSADLADEVDAIVIQERLDLPLEVLLVGRVDLGGQLDRHPRPMGHLDGAIGTLLRRHAPQEREVVTDTVAAGPELVDGQAVVDRPDPVRGRQRGALVVGDGDDRHLGELGIDRLEVRDVQAAVKRGQARDGQAPRNGEMEVVDVPVDDVVVVRVGIDALQLDDAVRQRVDHVLVQAQRPRNAGDQARARLRIAARVERDFVALADELLGQVRDDALGAAVEGRGHALGERRHLCDAHAD